jgi:glucose/arabinose dehydrogenase
MQSARDARVPAASRVLAHLVVLSALVILIGCDEPRRLGPPDTGSITPGTTITTSEGTRLGVEVVARNLQVPWSLAFAPDGRLFVAERPGRVRVIVNGTLLTEPALTLPDVAAVGEGGLLGMALHPRFAETRLVFLVYTAQRPGGGIVNRLARFREVDNRLAEGAVLLDDLLANNIHNGSRLRFGPDGLLYMTMGDSARPSVAQDFASYNGKILRVTEDGRTPSDNPFSSPVYTLGHRNPQGLDWHPESGELWASEHGEVGNDEINRVVAGANYGWPLIQGTDTRPGFEAPVLTFSPSVAPSGASFYTGATMPTLRSNLLVATLRGQHLLRVRFDPADPRRVLGTERLLEGRFGRLRDVITGPDGALYFSTSNRDGNGTPAAEDDHIFRLMPAR